MTEKNNTTDAYIDVAVALPVSGMFTYGVPVSMSGRIAIGKRVLVPFGQRRVTGYVVSAGTDSEQAETKHILDVLDDEPLFPAAMVPLFRWMSDYYIYPVGEVIKNALPGGLAIYDVGFVSITPAGERALEAGLAGPLETKILQHLANGTCRFKELQKKLNVATSLAVFGKMEKAGLISRKRKLGRGRTGAKTERYVSLRKPCPADSRLSPQRKTIIDILSQAEKMSAKELIRQYPSAAHLIRPMEKDGYLRIFRQRVYRDPFGDAIEPDLNKMLTDEQKAVVASITASLGKGFSSYLLAGVTGSGKTEVYLQLASQAIEQGLSVLVLVPEIALISQIERQFRARFGDCVAVIHSGLSSGERYDQWSRILAGEVTVAVGARSAVFAPFENLGLIVVDEEHDTSYKQESGPRYNARDLAVVRAKDHGCVVLLGSATPSLESYHNVQTGKYTEVSLEKRVESLPLPEISVVDLEQNREARGIRRFITPALHQAMTETLQKKEQILLFLNRRGFAGFPVCTTCGKSLHCKNCEISMTFHKEADTYKCHYCGFTRPSTSCCHTCGSENIRLLGLGTEKIEHAVKTLFPTARTARMDRDTITRRGALLQLLKGIRNYEFDVIVGTQMVAKGHDFPKITLVGIICADLSLSFPDFRAGERTFQLLAQVAGRAGRGGAPGSVILQTYNPGHFSILAAEKQNFKAFYKQEIEYRKALDYPPFTRMVQLQIAGGDESKTRETALRLGKSCRALRSNVGTYKKSVAVLGPIVAPLAKIAGQHRWQILLKGQAGPLHGFMNRLRQAERQLFNQRRIRIAIDVDPFFMM